MPAKKNPRPKTWAGPKEESYLRLERSRVSATVTSVRYAVSLLRLRRYQDFNYIPVSPTETRRPMRCPPGDHGSNAKAKRTGCAMRQPGVQILASPRRHLQIEQNKRCVARGFCGYPVQRTLSEVADICGVARTNSTTCHPEGPCSR